MTTTTMTSNPVREGINILQWNCHELRNKRDLLLNIIQDYDVLALSETWLTTEQNFNFHNFRIIRSDGPSSRSGGVIIAIKDWIPFTKIDSIYSIQGRLESIAIRIETPTDPIYIVSIYRHPGNFDYSNWDNLFSSIPSVSRIIIMGDFNAHHNIWGCASPDSVGKALLDSALDHTFYPLNDGTFTYISRPNQTPSAIDLTFASSDLFPSCSWTSLDDR